VQTGDTELLERNFLEQGNREDLIYNIPHVLYLSGTKVSTVSQKFCVKNDNSPSTTLMFCTIKKVKGAQVIQPLVKQLPDLLVLIQDVCPAFSIPFTVIYISSKLPNTNAPIFNLTSYCVISNQHTKLTQFSFQAIKTLYETQR